MMCNALSPYSCLLFFSVAVLLFVSITSSVFQLPTRFSLRTCYARVRWRTEAAVFLHLKTVGGISSYFPEMERSFLSTMFPLSRGIPSPAIAGLNWYISGPFQFQAKPKQLVNSLEQMQRTVAIFLLSLAICC